MKHSFAFLVLVASIVNPLRADVAIFPISGINVDRSFCDAFGALLANKYSNISGQKTIAPAKAAKVFGADSNLVAAARALNVSEYIEINAVGLYLSKAEAREYRDSIINGTRVIIQLEKDDDDDDEDNDNNQQMLDNQKTIVTAIRNTADGQQIYKAELTLLTYGDIEEASERIAMSLFKKITVEEARSMTNITRREGMGHNRLFAQSHKGIKMAAFYPVAWDTKLASFVTIGFDYRAAAEKFFLEFGAGGRIPSEITKTSVRKYGGNYFEIGGSYFFLNNQALGLYAGLGAIPFFNWLNDIELGVAPYLQAGIMMPRYSKVQFYVELRIAQNVLPVTTGELYNPSDYYFIDTEIPPPPRDDYPTEIGLEMGIAF